MIEAMNAFPIYSGLAIFGSVLFIVKLLMMFVGGDEAGDFDDGAMETDHSHGTDSFALLSVQSILAFFMGTGWLGLACRSEWKMDAIPSAVLASSFGFGMMVFTSYLLMKMKSLDGSPSNTIGANAIGLRGRAYTDIPPKGKGMGQVELTVNERQQILQASASSGKKIPAFSTVTVTKVDDSGNVVVEID